MIRGVLTQYRREILAGITVLVLGAVILVVTHLFTPAPVPTVTVPVTPAATCVSLVTDMETYNWQQPQLSASVLEQYATPKLAGELASAPHMTAGQIASHLKAVPTVTATTGSSGIIVTAKVSIPPVGVITTTMRCVVTAGRVSGLEPVT